MDTSTEHPWWHDVPTQQAGGDIIIGQVGDNATGVGIGKNIAITQSVYSALGPPQPSDKQVIEQKLAQFNEQLDKLAGQVDANTITMAKFQAKLLEGELKKTGKDETPSASTITQVGDWLLDSLPTIAQTLTSIFATPAVGRVVGKAGEIAVQWLKTRFGKDAPPPAAPAQAA